MAVTIKEFTKDFTREERATVAARTAELIAEFPNRQPVTIALADMAGEESPKPRRRGRSAKRQAAAS